MNAQELFKTMEGQWEGNCQTWFEPGQLADDSRVSGQFQQVLAGKFLRHTYTGSILNKPRWGEELIAFNSVSKQFQTIWIDDFHMNYAILFSQGNAISNGFSVRGLYDVGENQPPWGWRTEYVLEADVLRITAFNISPDGHEAKAVETIYHRAT